MILIAALEPAARPLKAIFSPTSLSIHTAVRCRPIWVLLIASRSRDLPSSRRADTRSRARDASRIARSHLRAPAAHARVVPRVSFRSAAAASAMSASATTPPLAAASTSTRSSASAPSRARVAMSRDTVTRKPSPRLLADDTRARAVAERRERLSRDRSTHLLHGGLNRDTSPFYPRVVTHEHSHTRVMTRR